MPRGMIVTLCTGSELGNITADQSVPSFVVRRVLFFLVREQKRLTLHAHQDFIFRNFEVVHQNGFAILPRGS